jgi:uncharacterized protein
MSHLTSFVTETFQTNVELTGQPVLRLRMAFSQNDDPSVVVYLLEIGPDGELSYLTEGHLRLLQRKLNTAQQTLHSYKRQDVSALPTMQDIVADMTLLPLSVLIRKGAHLELLLSSGDNATFTESSEFKAILSSASTLELPVRDSTRLLVNERK